MTETTPQMAASPRVSVLMPVYNGEDYLQEAVESVLSQTMGDLELIVLDDGSTDGTRAILERLAAKDTRLRVISRPNKGVSQSRNELIEAARAPILAMMDADDICLPDRLERQLARLEAEPELVALSGNCLMIDPVGRPIRTNDLPPDHETIEARHMEMPPNCSMAHPALMVRRSAMERVGGYLHDYPWAEDFDLYLRLGEIGRLANLEEVVVKYRLHPKSVGHANRLEQFESSIRAGHRARERRGLPKHETPIDAAAIIAAEAVGGASRRWGWWALAGGHLASARHYARKAVMEDPLSVESWRLMACALRDSLRAG